MARQEAPEGPPALAADAQAGRQCPSGLDRSDGEAQRYRFRFQQSAGRTRTCRAYRATPQSLALRRISDTPCDAPVEHLSEPKVLGHSGLRRSATGNGRAGSPRVSLSAAISRAADRRWYCVEINRSGRALRQGRRPVGESPRRRPAAAAHGPGPMAFMRKPSAPQARQRARSGPPMR